jgi:hypothetical protein
VNEDEAPVDENETSATEGEAPTSEGAAPADEGEPAAGEHEAPATESEVPADESKAPADENEGLVTKGEVIADEGEAPADQRGASASEREAPQNDGEAPADEGEAPASEGAAPPDDGELPPDEGEALVTEGEASADNGAAPASEHEAPPEEDERPMSEGKAPTNEDAATTANASEPADHAPAPAGASDVETATAASEDSPTEPVGVRSLDAPPPDASTSDADGTAAPTAVQEAFEGAFAGIANEIADRVEGDAPASEPAAAPNGAVLPDSIQTTASDISDAVAGGEPAGAAGSSEPDVFEDTRVKSEAAIPSVEPPESSPPAEFDDAASQSTQLLASDAPKSDGDVFHDTQVKGEAVIADDGVRGPLTEAQLEAALRAMMRRTRELPERGIRYAVCDYGRKKSAQLLLAEEYQEAADVDLAVDLIFVNIREDDRLLDALGQTQTLEQRLLETQQARDEITRRQDTVLEERRGGLRATLERLQQRQAEERAVFEEFWARPETRIPFSKPSVELLQVRQKQKAAALVHDFITAKAMKAKAEAMAREEAMQNERRFQQAMKIAYEQMLDQQQKEIDCVVAKGEVHLETLTAAKEHELLSNERTKRSLELRIQSPKHQKRPTIQLPVVKARGIAGTGPVPGMITQRTRTQLAKYRKSPDMGRLVLPDQEPGLVLRTSARRPPTAPLI